MTKIFDQTDYGTYADHCHCPNCGDVLVDVGRNTCPICGEEMLWADEDEPEVNIEDFTATHDIERYTAQILPDREI